ncbi:MAG: hypothetical protein QNK23_17970 [Crocinitomicaceae bacterium]|nr:hypothetical protein [Crocinitomicaceae bacterium]
MRSFLCLLYLFLAINCFGQSYSEIYQDQTRELLDQLKKGRKKFKPLLKARLKNGVLSRIDTLEFDYLFIQETICYRTRKLTTVELYFTARDSVIYINGEHRLWYDPGFYNWCKDQLGDKIKEHSTGRKQLLKNYSGLKEIQELAYFKTQVWMRAHSSTSEPTEEYVEALRKNLASTFQIQTLIKKQTSEIFVSVQYAPKNPKFETVTCHSGL